VVKFFESVALFVQVSSMVLNPKRMVSRCLRCVVYQSQLYLVSVVRFIIYFI